MNAAALERVTPSSPKRHANHPRPTCDSFHIKRESAVQRLVVPLSAASTTMTRPCRTATAGGCQHLSLHPLHPCTEPFRAPDPQGGTRKSTIVRCYVSGATRCKSLWEAARGFVTRHRTLSTVLGTVSLGLLGGFCNFFGHYFAEEVHTWIAARF